ncbi:MAG: hypothetical protein HXX16_19520 [Bacteroidales bacterium]|nr:hypothetical protein [Bacteroidales bacterium]
MTEIRLYKSPWRALKLLLISSVFVIIGIYLINQTDSSRFMAWLTICFFGLGLPVGLIQLFDRRPQIIINEIGIYDRTTRLETINWSIIKDAYPIDIHGQKFICLVVDEQYKPSKRKGLFYRNVVKFNEAIGAQEINLFLGQIRIDVGKLNEFILSVLHSEKNGLDRIEAIKKYVA